MKFTCLVTFALFAAVHSASVFLKPGTIPVKVLLYNEGKVHYTKSLENVAGSRNLNEKIQLSGTQIKQLSEENENQEHFNSVRNLDAKVQLSPEELLQAEKHLPLEGKREVIGLKSNSDEENQQVLQNLNQNADAQPASSQEIVKPTESAKPIEVNRPDETVFGILGESSSEKETAIPQSTSAPPVTTEENLPDPNLVLLIQIAQNIVASGLTTIRENIDNLGTNGETNKNPPISAEQWNRLNQTISDFFSTLLQTGTRASDGNILQYIVNGIRSATNNFVRSLQVEIDDSLKAAEPQRPGAGQNIVRVISSGVQEITQSIYNIPNQSITKDTNLEDVNVPTESSGPIQNIINSVQQFFGGQTATNPSHVLQDGEASTPPPPSGPVQVIQSVAQQVGQVFNNLNPFTTAKPTVAPGSQGDEASTPPNPIQSIQNVANQVGQAINNLNPFRPSTAAPGSQGDAPTTLNPLQSIQNAANQVGQAINSLNPFNPPSTAAPGSQGDAPTTLSPLQSIQNAANQVGQAINSLNPFNPPSTAAPGSQGDAPTTTNPLQSIQNAANQVGQAINNLNPFRPGSTAAPGAQNEGTTAGANGPLQAVQNVVNQFGEVVNNFINPSSTPAASTAGLQNEEVTSTNKPLQGVQNVINQVGQAVGSLNPVNQGSTSAPPNNPLEGVQNAINQVGQVAGGLNPINQGSGAPSLPLNPGSTTVPSNNPLQGVQNAIDQGVQNAINQGVQIAGGLNPINQGSGVPLPPLNQGSVTVATNNPLQDIQNADNQATNNPNLVVQGPGSTPSPIGGAQLVAVHPVNSVAVEEKPAGLQSGNVETVQSVGNQLIHAQKKPEPEVKVNESVSEQEIMVALE